MKDMYTDNKKDMQSHGQINNFRNLINKYEQRNFDLEEHEAELQHRLHLIEASLPAILVWNMWRIFQNEPVSCADVAQAMSKSKMRQGKSPVPSRPPPRNIRPQSATEECRREPCETRRPETSPCSQEKEIRSAIPGPFISQQSYQEASGEKANLKIHELEVERQRLIGERQEAEVRWRNTEEELRSKLQELESNREMQALQIARQAEEGFRARIGELEEELRVLKDQSQEPTITMVYGAIQHNIQGNANVTQEDIVVTNVLSIDTIKSCDLECMKRLQELVESELNTKKRIAELERKEATYMDTLQQADRIWLELEQECESNSQIECTKESVAGIPERMGRPPRPCDEPSENTLISRIRELEQVINNLNNIIERMENEKVEMISRYNELACALANSERNMERLQEDLCTLQRNFGQKCEDMRELENGYNYEILTLKAKLSSVKSDFKHASCECESMKEERLALELRVQELITEKKELDKTIIELSGSLADKETELQHAIAASQVELQAIAAPQLDQPKVFFDLPWEVPTSPPLPQPETPPAAPHTEPKSLPKPEGPRFDHITTCDTDFDEEEYSIPTVTTVKPSQPPVAVSGHSGPQPPEVASAHSAAQPPQVALAHSGPQPPEVISAHSAAQPPEVASAHSAAQPPEVASAHSAAQPPASTSHVSDPGKEAERIVDGVVSAIVKKSDRDNIGRDVDAIVAHTKECQNCSVAVDEAIQTLFNQILALNDLIARGHMVQASAPAQEDMFVDSVSGEEGVASELPEQIEEIVIEAAPGIEQEPSPPASSEAVPAECAPLCWDDSPSKGMLKSKSITSDPSCSILCWAESPFDQVEITGEHPEVKLPLLKEGISSQGVDSTIAAPTEDVIAEAVTTPEVAVHVEEQITRTSASDIKPTSFASFEYNEDDYSRTTAEDFEFGEAGSFSYESYRDVTFTDSALDMPFEDDAESVHLGSNERLFMDEFPSKERIGKAPEESLSRTEGREIDTDGEEEIVYEDVEELLEESQIEEQQESLSEPEKSEEVKTDTLQEEEVVYEDVGELLEESQIEGQQESLSEPEKSEEVKTDTLQEEEVVYEDAEGPSTEDHTEEPTQMEPGSDTSVKIIEESPAQETPIIPSPPISPLDETPSIPSPLPAELSMYSTKTSAGYRIERITSSTSPMADEFSIIRYKDPHIEKVMSTVITLIEEEVAIGGGIEDPESGIQDITSPADTTVPVEKTGGSRSTDNTELLGEKLTENEPEELEEIPPEIVIIEES